MAGFVLGRRGPRTNDGRRHVKQGRTCAVEGNRAECSTVKCSSLTSVKPCQGKVAVCRGVKVLTLDIFAPRTVRGRCRCVSGVECCPGWFCNVLGDGRSSHPLRLFFLVEMSRARSCVCFAGATVVFLFCKIEKTTALKIEDFVETHLCKLCVIHRSRVLRGTGFEWPHAGTISPYFFAFFCLLRSVV